MRQNVIAKICAVLALGLFLLLSGCGNKVQTSSRPAPPPPPPVVAAPSVEAPRVEREEAAVGEETATGAREPTRGRGDAPPRQHLWDVLLQMDDEAPGYGMYTYVLFGRRLDLSSLDQETLQRYQQLLDAIVGSTLSSGEAGDLTAAEKQATNLLYIPGTVRGSAPSLANYNSALAMRYLVELGRVSRADNQEVAERLATRPGPFLVSVLKPVGTIDSRQTTLLYADLSTTNPAAMEEIVAAYKLRVSRNSLDEVQQFAPLRLALLNLVLNTDDNIKLVKAALAVWIPQ